MSVSLRSKVSLASAIAMAANNCTAKNRSVISSPSALFFSELPDLFALAELLDPNKAGRRD
jgi:hypothetical protein